MRLSNGSVLVAVLGLAACNPSSFNSILDHAPVVVTDTGGSSTSSLFVLPLPPQTGATAAARALITSSSKVFLVEYDSNGKVTLNADDESTRDMGGDIHSAAIRADGMILLGVPGFDGGLSPRGRVSTAVMTTAADGSTKLTVTPLLHGGSHLGISVAAGNITGAASGDFVALGNGSVQLIPGAGVVPEALSCANVDLGPPPLFVGTYGFRPIAIGNLLGEPGDEVVLGGVLAGGKGVVVFVEYDPLSGKLQCPTKVLAEGLAQGFGTSLAIADYDGDGQPDLAVGVPPKSVQIYFGPLDAYFAPVGAKTAPDVTITNPNSIAFGKKIAPLFVAGMAAAQLMVADPSGNSGKGGDVRIYTIARGATTIDSKSATAVLFDSNSDLDSSMLGLSLGTLPFEGRMCGDGMGSLQAVPFASIGPNLLTFFAYSGGSPDPRCFARKK